MLYELLTGSKPHEGESPIAVAYKHVHEDVPAAVARWCPASRRTSTRWSPAPPPATATSGRPTPASCSTSCTASPRRSPAACWDDEELTADLAPQLPPPAGRPTTTSALDLLPDRRPRSTSHLRRRRRVGRTGPCRRAPGPPAPALPARPDPAGRRPRPRPAAGLGAYWFGWARYTATPSVLGLGQQAATHKLEHAGFKVALASAAFSESVPKGDVITTDPLPGARVLDHGTVTLTVSHGRERYAVPKVQGKNVNQAQDALLGGPPDLRPL